MSFWDEHAKAEAAHDEARRAQLPPSSQNAPARCACGHVGEDVILGVCGPCFDLWDENQEWD